MFDLPALAAAVPFALALWFFAVSAAAVITTTEPGIDDVDKRLRTVQAVQLALVSIFFSIVFFISYASL